MMIKVKPADGFCLGEGDEVCGRGDLRVKQKPIRYYEKESMLTEKNNEKLLLTRKRNL